MHVMKIIRFKRVLKAKTLFFLPSIFKKNLKSNLLKSKKINLIGTYPKSYSFRIRDAPSITLMIFINENVSILEA